MHEQRGRPPKRRDDGISLVELIVAMSLLALVLAIAGGVLINGLKTQQTTNAVTNAANTAQQIASSIQSGVRNATAVVVTSDETVGTQLLIVRKVGVDPSSTAASCQAWYYTPLNGGSVYTRTSSPAAAIAVPIGEPDVSWSLLGTGVSPADTVTGRVFNAPTGSRVDIKFNVSAGTHPYVLINTTTYTPQMTTVSSPCF